MTPDEVAEKAREKAEADEQRKADARERRYQRAKETVAAEKAATRPAPILVFDGEEDWRDIEWLIDQRIPAEGAGMLFGETDGGKTFISLNVSIHVSAGLSWQGQAVTRGTVLFIEAEGGRSFALRKHAAKQQAGLDSGRNRLPFELLPFVTVYESLGFGPDTDLALVQARATAIRTEAAQRGWPPIRFVVVDTLAQNIHGDADSNNDMTAFLRAFRAFLKALSVESVFGLLIHHPGHADKTRGRGAYALPADLDLILHLEGEHDELTLSCDRMRDGERFEPILLALEKRLVKMDDGRTATTLVVVSRTETGAANAESHATQIVKHLRLHPQRTTAQISTDLCIRKSVVVKQVDALCDDGTLRRIEVKSGKTGQIKQMYEVAATPDVVPETETAVAL